MQTYTAGSLYFLPYVLSREGNQGLHEGTLYDVLDTASLVHSNATVDATGFNVTCGFLTAPSIPTTLSPDAIWQIPSDTGVPADMQGEPMVIYSTRAYPNCLEYPAQLQYRTGNDIHRADIQFAQ